MESSTEIQPPEKKPEKKLAPPPVRDLYPLPEARTKLGDVSAASIYRWASQGKIRLTKIGGRTFISAGEIERLTGSPA